MATPSPLPAEAPRTRRERQRLETRELLFELAVEEFRRVGTEAARVRDIADGAGVVPGTFYFHFPTKDHVIHELWLRNCSQVVAMMAITPERKRALADDLRRFGDALLVVEEKLGDDRLARDSIGIVLRPPSGIDLSSNPVRTWIEARLQAAKASGEASSELDAEELAAVLLSAILGALAAAPSERRARRRFLRRTVDFFLRALR